jgi:hypothetical protein
VARTVDRTFVGRVRWRNPRDSGHIKGLRVYESIILQWISKTWDGGMGWIGLGQSRERWRAVVNAAINFCVLLNAGNFVTS